MKCKVFGPGMDAPIYVEVVELPDSGGTVTHELIVPGGYVLKVERDDAARSIAGLNSSEIVTKGGA